MNSFSRHFICSAVLIGTTALTPRAVADVTLPTIFSDHMVLQRDIVVPVWGWANPGEQVVVSIGAASKSATADAAGKWKLQLDKLQGAEPDKLTVKGKNTIVINDVLVGEVWLCSGQSNMSMRVTESMDADAEKAAAKFPQIRMYTVDSGAAVSPQEKCAGHWEVCSPASVGNFSAAGYFFGRELHKNLGVPVGLINSSVGGTAIEAWTSQEAMANKPELKPILEHWEKEVAAYDAPEAKARFEAETAAWKELVEKAKAENKPAPRGPQRAGRSRLDNNHPANLFNGKIAPLLSYAIRGAIWYQGESNAGNGSLYGQQLPLMINDWRARWQQGDFPFGFVQLPNFMARSAEPGTPSGWAAVRESMLKTLALPNTGMSVNMDIGEANDIHPKNKQEIGRRLSLWALAKVYGKDLPYAGPFYDKLQVNGAEAILTFKNTNGGLAARGGDLKGFIVAGADKKWAWATAKIDGDRVVLSAPDVKEPVAVRYAWGNNPECNLINGAGLLASPFRTDDWQ
ncbi:MAG: hypothetical protein JWL90_5 [Chthoniobacteraceae bacterium]|nr:hypothetical protein [Chthoniobacteraceae bacterium]